MPRALPIVLSAVLVGGIAGATWLPDSKAADAASAGRVSAQAQTDITPIVDTDWKTAGLTVGSAYAKQEQARKAAKMARLQKEAAALGLTFSSQSHQGIVS
jgi:hypothetical protein